ncbi:hypothetical protein G6F57_016629 [Rhizopus arrhizus]|nr:hypothetical protein G6F57_016629 [Rhizopus arrhizus]
MRILPFDDPDVVSRKLRRTEYALYGRPGQWNAVAGDGRGCRLILMDTAFGKLPDVGWVTGLLPDATIGARSNSRETQARLCALGVGLAVLPRPLGDATPGIAPINIGETPPARDTWLGWWLHGCRTKPQAEYLRNNPNSGSPLRPNPRHPIPQQLRRGHDKQSITKPDHLRLVEPVVQAPARPHAKECRRQTDRHQAPEPPRQFPDRQPRPRLQQVPDGEEHAGGAGIDLFGQPQRQQIHGQRRAARMRDHHRDARRATRQQRLVLRPRAGLHRRPAAPPQPREEQGVPGQPDSQALSFPCARAA